LEGENIVRVPDKLLKCVGFISAARQEPDYIGTMFIVGMAGKWGNAYQHAVTARHVARSLDGEPYMFGVNFKDGKAGWFSSKLKWWYHPTEPDSVDVAVTVFTPSERMDVEYVPEGVFATDERIKHYGIGLGDEVNAVGLFFKFFGATKHIPIVRTGNIAMMPSDKLPMSGGASEAYLVEGRSIGGLSGSPVFVRHTVSMPGMARDTGEKQMISGVSHLHMLGLMHGHWDSHLELTVGEAEAVNMGIAIVIPAQKILEVLYHPELVAMRAQQDEQYRKWKGISDEPQ
jgi:hypothetical protein